MKYKTTVTVALTSFAIFMVLAVAGGICVAAGFSDYARNSGVIENAQDLIDYVEEFDINYTPASAGETKTTSEEYTCELGREVKAIVIATGGCSVDVRSGSEFSVSFTGKTFIDKLTEAVSSADAGYDHSGIINAGFNNGTLDITIESARTFNIVGFGANTSIGRLTVTVPSDYNGSLELKDSFAEIDLSGLDFNELVFTSCMGEIELRNCSANMLTISNLAGEASIEGGNIAGICFEKIAGEINLEPACELTADSIISDVAGEISIELPRGAQLNVTQDDVLGSVRIDRAITGGAGAANLTVSDVVGEVHVEIDD